RIPMGPLAGLQYRWHVKPREAIAPLQQEKREIIKILPAQILVDHRQVEQLLRPDSLYSKFRLGDFCNGEIIRPKDSIFQRRKRNALGCRSAEQVNQHLSFFKIKVG